MSDRLQPSQTQDLDVLTNQTTFAEEHPLYENDQPPTEVLPTAPMSKRKKMIIGGVVGVVLLVIVLAIASALLPKRQVVQTQPTGLQYTPPPVVDSALRHRVRELGINLNDADPVKVDLPFPPVGMEITLDPVRR